LEEPLYRAVSAAIRAGYQVDKETFEFMRELPPAIDLETLMTNVIRQMETLSERSILIDFRLVRDEAGKSVERLGEGRGISSEELARVESGKTGFHPYAKDVAGDLKVVEDPTDEIEASGAVKDYMGYFQDRFRRMSRLLKQRMDVKDAATLSEAIKAPHKAKMKIICMIIEKRESKRGLFLTVEDAESTATVYVPLDGPSPAIEKARSLLLDQVLCMTINKGKSDLLIAEDFILPELPNRKPNRAPVSVSAALISDLHVGSKMFMEKDLQRFIRWLKGEVGDERTRTVAGRVKYVLIAGDVVDGVGIYPQQIDELSIKDLYKQYEASARILENIPDYIEVVVIPGNHDGARRALPQPAIDRKYAESLYEARRIQSVGDPSVISLHGVNVLLYHGRSLDDVISSVPDMSFQRPSKAMKLLLQCRHLAPAYGQRTPIAPERRDHLVVENAPDIFHAGHVHVMEYGTYRGCVIANSGAWQGQTEYQREMGHIPNPGIVPIVNLQALEIFPIDFTALSG